LKSDVFKGLGISYIALLIILKVSFYQTSLMLLIKGTLLFYLVYIIPGLLITYLLFDKLYAVERYALAFLIGVILMGIFGYYSGILLNLHIITSPYIMSALIIIPSVVYLRKKKLFS